MKSESVKVNKVSKLDFKLIMSSLAHKKERKSSEIIDTTYFYIL